MADNNQASSDNADRLHDKAVQASVERDVAVEAAIRAKEKEAEAMEIARQQHEVAVNSQVDAIEATGREAVIKEVAREEHEEALESREDAIRASEKEAVARASAEKEHAKAVNAKADAESMNTLRQVASIRAEEEARSGDRARFLLYMILGILFTVLLAAGIWLFTRS
ncbi:MAG: hypothetical protein ACYC0V_06605 [Armatimonadota bacterium]